MCFGYDNTLCVHAFIYYDTFLVKHNATVIVFLLVIDVTFTRKHHLRCYQMKEQLSQPALL